MYSIEVGVTALVVRSVYDPGNLFPGYLGEKVTGIPPSEGKGERSKYHCDL